MDAEVRSVVCSGECGAELYSPARTELPPFCFTYSRECAAEASLLDLLSPISRT